MKVEMTDDGRFLDEEGCSYDTIHSLIGIHELGLCGCGYAETIVDLAHKTLKILKAKSVALDNDRSIGLKVSDQQRTDLNAELAKLVPDDPFGELLFHVMDNAGWLEHGTSIRWSWLTPEGEHALMVLDEFAHLNPFYDGHSGSEESS